MKKRKTDPFIDVLQLLFPDSFHLDVSWLVFGLLTKIDLGFMRLVCKEWRDAIPAQKYLEYSRLYVREYRKKDLREQMLSFAVKNGSILLLKLLFKQGIKEELHYFSDEIGLATRKGYFECIVFAYKNRIIDESSICKSAPFAAKYGLEKPFFWLAKEALKCDPGLPDYTCDYACESGNLTILKACIGFGLKPGSGCMCAAAKGAHFNILEYGFENDFPTSSSVCAHAASSGNLECLKFLLEKGIPCTQSATLWAYESKRYEIMEFLLSRGYPCYTLLKQMAFRDKEEDFHRLIVRYK